jgi:hypothetical protein
LSPFGYELYALGGLWPGLNAYTAHWTFNGSIYPLIESSVRELLRVLAFDEPERLRQSIKALSAAFVCLVGWYLPRRLPSPSKSGPELTQHQSQIDHETSVVHLCTDAYTNQRILRSCFICILVFLILSPVVYSWYLIWAIPLATLILGHRVPKSHFLVVISVTTLVWGALCSCTYIPRLSYLSDNIWYFSDLWILMEYGTLGLTFVLATRYTLTSS